MSSVSQPLLSGNTSSALPTQRLAKFEPDTPIPLRKVIFCSKVFYNICIEDLSSLETMNKSGASIIRSPSPTSVMRDISPYEQTNPCSDVYSMSESKALQNAALLLFDRGVDDQSLNEKALNSRVGQLLQKKVRAKAEKKACQAARRKAYQLAEENAKQQLDKKMRIRQRQLQKRANWSRTSYTRTVSCHAESEKKATRSATGSQTICMNIPAKSVTAAYQGIAHEVVVTSLHVPVKVKHSDTATVTVQESALASQDVTVNPESFKKMASNMKQKCRGWLSSQCMRSSSSSARPTNPEANVAPATR